MSSPSSYHHGNLRQALLEAARALAAENTIDSITLREVARRAGVSHAAPYHHFADKRALLRALALDAFKELHHILNTILKSTLQADPTTHPTATLSAIGLAYLQFALSHPTEFRFMFRKTLCEPQGTPDELTEVANQTLEMLIQTLRSLQEAGAVVAGDPHEYALVVLSALHGMAHLLIEAPIAPEPLSPSYLEGLARGISHTLLHGLLVKA